MLGPGRRRPHFRPLATKSITQTLVLTALEVLAKSNVNMHITA